MFNCLLQLLFILIVVLFIFFLLFLQHFFSLILIHNYLMLFPGNFRNYLLYFFIANLKFWVELRVNKFYNCLNKLHMLLILAIENNRLRESFGGRPEQIPIFVFAVLREISYYVSDAVIKVMIEKDFCSLNETLFIKVFEQFLIH